MTNTSIFTAFVCLAIFAPLSIEAITSKQLACGDYTLDKCTIELEGLLETVKDITEEFCQKYCDVIYAGRCEFFIYDRKQRICNLLQQPIETYVQTCKKIGGPKTPSIDECDGSADPCKSFLEGYCRFEGSLLEHLEDIESESQCQFACLFLEKCNYFLFDIDLKDCELFDSESRDCDLMRGPPKPEYETCFDEPTTLSEFNQDY